MDFIVSTLQRSPELAIFASLAIGYWIGVIKLGSFSLGTVTGTLLVAILIGQALAVGQGHVLEPNGVGGPFQRNLDIIELLGETGAAANGADQRNFLEAVGKPAEKKLALAK